MTWNAGEWAVRMVSRMNSLSLFQQLPMKKRRLILASGSEYRRELLRRLVCEFESIAPEIDELSFHAASASPELLATRLAFEKSAAVFEQHSDAVVIGSDQLVDLAGTVLGKPGTFDAAVSQLMTMSGRQHRLLTAVCVHSPAGRIEFLNETWLQMRALSHHEAVRYVERDQPLDCAGSYRIESLGIALFENIRTDDATAIMGLPLIRLSQVLRDLGFAVP